MCRYWSLLLLLLIILPLECHGAPFPSHEPIHPLGKDHRQSTASRIIKWIQHAGHSVYNFFAGKDNVFKTMSGAWKKVNSISAVRETSATLKEKLKGLSHQHLWHKLKKDPHWKIYFSIWINCSVLLVVYTILMVRGLRLVGADRSGGQRPRLKQNNKRKQRKRRRLRNPFAKKTPETLFSPEEDESPLSVRERSSPQQQNTDGRTPRRFEMVNLRDVDFDAESPLNGSSRLQSPQPPAARNPSPST